MAYDRYPELTAVNRLRVEQDLTYRALGTLVGVNYRTLHALLNDPDPRPYDRTLYRIRAFLERLEQVVVKPRRTRKTVREVTV